MSIPLHKVLIVGGGVAGTAMAILLRKRGVPVDLIDIDPVWTGQGAGITITGPTLRALRPTGVLDRFFEYGAGWSGGYVFDQGGRLLEELQTFPLEDGTPATAGIHRADLHNLLVDNVRALGTNIRLGVTATALHDEGDQVVATFSDGTTGRYDLAIAADGVFSKLRQKMLPDSGTPQYTGQAAWRATVARPADVQGRCSYFGPRNKAGFNPVSQRQMYIYLVQNFRCSCGLPTPSFRRSCASSSWILAEWEKVSDMPSADPAGVLDRTLKTLAQPF